MTNRKKPARLMLALPIVLATLLAGCGKPTITYRAAADDGSDAYKLKEGQLLFKLRTSDIAIMPPAPADPKAPVPAGIDVCGKDASPEDCLAQVSAKATAASVAPLYLASPADSVPFTYTKLAATTVDGNDDLPMGVTVSYNDNIKGAISGATATATALYPLLGPVGAIAGIAVALSSTPGGGAMFTKADPDANKQAHVLKFLCEDDKKDLTDRKKTLALGTELHLTLPVVVTVKTIDAQNPPRDCWHLLPQSATPTKAEKEATKGGAGNGWLYRIRFSDQQPYGAVKTAAYFEAEAEEGKKTSGKRHDFPYSPCHAATLQLAWWNNLGDANPTAREYPLQLANPTLVQARPMPKAGSINLGAVCGASVSFSEYKGNTAKDNVEALVKAVTELKAAQEAYKKANKDK